MGEIAKLKASLRPISAPPRRLLASQTRRPNRSSPNWLKATCGQTVDPDSIFDCQIKRIHEYKRQMLNALRIIVLYNRLKANPELDMVPRTFFFAGKAAPGYVFAKLIIKFLNNLAGTIDGDPVTRGVVNNVSLPTMRVLRQHLMPAANVSNQISTAGYEASGTSNMKFMMNGALTIGTRDGATIEMAEEAGEENFLLFGLSAQQVADSRGWYSPYWHYGNEPETRAALDLISGTAAGAAPSRRCTMHYWRKGIATCILPISGLIWTPIGSCELYRDGDEWASKAILNVAGSGKFSSDRTIAQYAAEIWNAKPCRIPWKASPRDERFAARRRARGDLVVQATVGPIFRMPARSG